MASALEEFRAQREAVEDLRARLMEVAELVRAARAEAVAVARDETLRTLLSDEQSWLRRAQDLVREVRGFREQEIRRFWPAVWRRWAVAAAFAVATTAAAGAGYVWAARPYETEMEQLRARVELLDFVAARVFKMTPAEQRQFDVLMKWNEPLKRPPAVGPAIGR